MYGVHCLPPVTKTTRLRPANLFCGWNQQNANVPWQIEKTNFGLIVYSHNPNNPENLAKIGAVDFEIIGLTRIDKTRQINKKQKQKM